MSKARWFAGAAVSAVAVGALAIGGGTAFADTATATTAPAAANTKTCTVRIPAMLKRIDTITTRINGDASTKGSTAWLQAKETKAGAAGDTALADLIQLRVSHRADRLAELAKATTAIQGVQSKDCPA